MMSNHSAPIPTCITSDYILRTLQNFFSDDSFTIKKYEITRASSVGNNYISQVLNIKVEYMRNGHSEKRHIIAKILPKTELSKEVNKNFYVFSVEMKMMSKALPLIFKELSGKIGVEKFFPYVYHTDIDNNIIFMEDLKTDGYLLADRKMSLDLEHVLLTVKALARLHASSYIMFEKNPDYKNEYMECFWRTSEGAIPGKLMNRLYKTLLQILDSWPISSTDKDIFRSFDGKLADLMTETCQMKESNFNVLLHGDCWASNLMFKYENEKVHSVKLLDYQLSNYNSLGLDLNYFLFTSAMEYVKTDHLEEVLQTYFDTFVDIAGRIEGFTVHKVREEFVKGLGFGFAVATTFRFTMTAEKGFDLDIFLKDEKGSDCEKIYRREEFISELVNLLPIFKHYGLFMLK